MEFITSDRCVISWNKLFYFLFSDLVAKSETPDSQIGFLTFFPVSPKLLLMLYDREAYNIHGNNRGRSIVKLFKFSDILDINVLHILAAKNIYFRNENFDMEALREVFEKRSEKAIGTSTLLEGGLIDPGFSFLKVKRSVRDFQKKVLKTLMSKGEVPLFKRTI